MYQALAGCFIFSARLGTSKFIVLLQNSHPGFQK